MGSLRAACRRRRETSAGSVGRTGTYEVPRRRAGFARYRFFDGKRGPCRSPCVHSGTTCPRGCILGEPTKPSRIRSSLGPEHRRFNDSSAVADGRAPQLEPPAEITLPRRSAPRTLVISCMSSRFRMAHSTMTSPTSPSRVSRPIRLQKRPSSGEVAASPAAPINQYRSADTAPPRYRFFDGKPGRRPGGVCSISRTVSTSPCSVRIC